MVLLSLSRFRRWIWSDTLNFAKKVLPRSVSGFGLVSGSNQVQAIDRITELDRLPSVSTSNINIIYVPFRIQMPLSNSQ
jgi:hypothetical protein